MDEFRTFGKYFTLVTAAALLFVLAIMVVAHEYDHKSTPLCDKSGVYKVIRYTKRPDVVTICKNGRVMI